MTTSSDARNPVEALAEQFLDRKRRGEQPTLREYVARYPELADDIRDLFPALLMMEDLGESSGGTTGALAADTGAAVGARLQWSLTTCADCGVGNPMPGPRPRRAGLPA